MHALSSILALILACPSVGASANGEWSHTEAYDNGGKAKVRARGGVDHEWRGEMKRPRRVMRLQAARPPRPEAPTVDPAPSRPSAAAEAAADGVRVSAWEVEVVDLVNERRVAGAYCGGQFHAPAAPLVLEARLQLAADGHSADMLARRFVGHDSPSGQSPFDRMKAAGYSFTAAGENVAAGQRSPEAVVEAWMASPGHCRNIMNPRFTETGLGHVSAEGPDGFGHYWTQKFGSREWS